MPDLKPEPNTIDPTDGLTPRQRVLNTNERLRQDLSSWIAHWRDINDYVLPRRLSYLISDKNSGSKKNGKIINSAATRAARILAAGKMAGETSPARPWSRYAPPRDVLNNRRAIDWVALAEREVTACFNRSNLYSCLHELWLGQGVFGTSVLYVEEDDEKDVRGYTFPLGQYALASTLRGRADTIYRDFTTMTVVEVVRTFGIDNCSPRLRERFKKGEWRELVALIHVLAPNLARTTGLIDNQNMPWLSEWWEKDAESDWGRPLRRSGYEEQCFMVARWNVLGDDIYGSDCPGMDALGDTKGLQHMAACTAEAADKIVAPPIKAPMSMKSSRLSMLPRDASYVDEGATGTKVEPMVKVDPNAVTVGYDAQEKDEMRIMRVFHADLFQAFLMDDNTQPRTAYEMSRRYEEKMLQLGPVITLDNDDVLDKLHNRVLRILIRRGKIPPPPPELMGRPIQVEYVSAMAQAQKLLGTAGTERFIQVVGSVSAIQKNVTRLPNLFKMLRRYADQVGVPPADLNTEDEVAAMLAQDAQQAQQAQQLAAAQSAAETAKTASEADTNGDNVLSRLMAGTGMAGPNLYGGGA